MFDNYVFNYILNDQGEPEPCDDLEFWSIWHLSDERRKVRQQTFPNAQGQEIYVSTVFLGTNHQFGDGPPVLWETMVWVGDEHLDFCWRYTSREAAIAGHARVVLDLGGIALDEPAPAHECEENT